MSNGQVFAPGQQFQGIEPGPRDFYVYRALFTALGVAGQQNQNINIEADSNFYLTALTYFADLAGAAQTDSTRVIPLVTVQATDSGSGRNLFNGAVPVSAVFGQGDRPARLVHPRLFQRTTSIAIQVVNFSAATTYTNLYLCFIGFKVYGVRR